MLRCLCRAFEQATLLCQLPRVTPPALTRGPTGLPGVSSCLPLGSVEQRRTTIIVERMYPAPLPKKGQKPRLRDKHKILKIVEIERNKPTPDIQCILTDYVEGVGNRGEMLTVKRRLFRNYLFPMGLAKYASPENVEEWRKETQERGQVDDSPKLSIYGRMTAKKLSGMFLPIPMSGDNPWSLNKTHVKVAFRRMYVELTEECIELPDEDITEPQDLEIKVTINGMETVPVKARIYLVYKDAAKNIIPDMPPLFQSLWSNRLQ